MRHKVPLGGATTELLLGVGSSKELAETVLQRHQRWVVVSDANVTKSVRPHLFSAADWLVVPAGEASKSVDRSAWLWSQMIEQRLDRESAVVAVGGGVVGDLAGFAAATFLRGVSFYSIPTSLLAMVDASVGGKVGIDLPEGKNLVGQFYPAQIVAVDPSLLSTLPSAEWSAGMAEVVKHGILSGESLWSALRQYRPDDKMSVERTEALVADAVMVKVGVVKEDPYEKTGLRATLNLGHSYGHAIEWCSDFSLNHGEAVALGLVCGLRLSRELGLLEDDFEEDLVELLRRWGLPTSIPLSDSAYSWERMAEALGRDKKNKDGKWCFVLPRRVGEVTTVFGPDPGAVKRAYRSLLNPEGGR